MQYDNSRAMHGGSPPHSAPQPIPRDGHPFHAVGLVPTRRGGVVQETAPSSSSVHVWWHEAIPYPSAGTKSV